MCHVDGPNNAFVVLLSRVSVVVLSFALDRPASSFVAPFGDPHVERLVCLDDRGMRTAQVSGVVSGTRMCPGLAAGVGAPTSGQEPGQPAQVARAPVMVSVDPS